MEELVAAKITIIGLGPGDPELLTREAWKVLAESEEIYLRTVHHPVVAHLPKGLSLKTFDNLYEELDDFEAVYRAIVAELVDLANRPQGVVYAVPGDPTVGEATVLSLRKIAIDDGMEFRIIHGVSFVEPCLDQIGVDGLDGLSIADALELAAGHHPLFNPDTPVLIGQLYSRFIAGEVKLTLMNQYPDDHSVRLIHACGTPEADIESLPLHAIDHSQRIGSLTALFVPQLPMQSAFESFQETVAHLRAPDGCPWDGEQTHKSLRNHLLQETYEALQALDAEDTMSLREELGDLLLQIVLHAQIGTEEGEFTMAEVINGIQTKILRRHPHVFGETQVASVDHVLHNWEALKATEREIEGDGKGILDGVPLCLPALAQASEIQARVVRVGFDWPDVEGVLEKISEEIEEIRQSDTETRSDEIGDLLFSIVNYARWLKVDSEAALREANLRFRSRFRNVEESARAAGRELTELTLKEMNAMWEAAKRKDEDLGRDTK